MVAGIIIIIPITKMNNIIIIITCISKPDISGVITCPESIGCFSG